MAKQANWYHAHLDAVSRGEGKSSVGLASYMTGEKLKDELTGKWCRRNHPGEVLDWGTVAPPGAPAWLTKDDNLGKAWNAVERSEKRKDSHVANHWNIASSREFSEADHIAVAQKMAEAISQKYGLMVTWAVHKPTDHGDDRNWHIHLGYNMRRVGPEGFGAKAREIAVVQTRVEHTIWQRKMLAQTINHRLEFIGSDERVSHASYKAQGIEREAQRHRGNDVNQLELKGEATEVGDFNRAVRQHNAERDAALARLISINSEITYLEKKRKTAMDAEEINTGKLHARENDSLREILKNKERADDYLREFAARKTDAEKHEKELAESQRSKERLGEIDDAKSRFAQASRKFNGDPESMLAVVSAEHDAYRESQDKLKDAIAKQEDDPDKRKSLQLRHDIQEADYNELVHQRLAGQSYVITGKRGALEQIDEEGTKHQVKTGHQLEVDAANYYGAKADVLRDEYRDHDRAQREQTVQQFAKDVNQVVREAKDDTARTAQAQASGRVAERDESKAERMAAVNAAYKQGEEARGGQSQGRGGISR